MLRPLGCLNQDVAVHKRSVSALLHLNGSASPEAFPVSERSSASPEPLLGLDLITFSALLQGPTSNVPPLGLTFPPSHAVLVLVLPDQALQFIHLITALLRILQ